MTLVYAAVKNCSVDKLPALCELSYSLPDSSHAEHANVNLREQVVQTNKLNTMYLKFKVRKNTRANVVHKHLIINYSG